LGGMFLHNLKGGGTAGHLTQVLNCGTCLDDWG
jgi:hypothetical protein